MTPTFSDSIPAFLGTTALDPSLDSPGGIISALLPYALIIGGLILLFMLISGGFQKLTAVNDPEKAAAGTKKITTAFGGFVLLFSIYWIFQAVEYILGLRLLEPII